MADSPGLRSSPMLDVAAGSIYVFVFDDRSANCSGVGCRAIVQFSTASFAANSSGVSRTLGIGGSNTGVQYEGGFDSTWYHSVDSTGSIYVCAGNSSVGTTSSLWKVPLVVGVLGIPQEGANAANFTSTCSPLAIVKNGLNEYLYYSVTDYGDDGAASSCTGGCIYMMSLSDLNGALADVSETWVLAIANNGGNGQTVLGETFQVNGVTFTTANNNTGTNVDVTGNRATDCANIAGRVIANVPGWTASCASPNVSISRSAPGDISNLLVTENLTTAVLNPGSHVEGLGGVEWSTSNAPAAGLQSTSGTSGIIIDNISGVVGASQIYYSQLISNGNAVQASQAGLQ